MNLLRLQRAAVALLVRGREREIQAPYVSVETVALIASECEARGGDEALKEQKLLWV